MRILTVASVKQNLLINLIHFYNAILSAYMENGVWYFDILFIITSDMYKSDYTVILCSVQSKNSRVSQS